MLIVRKNARRKDGQGMREGETEKEGSGKGESRL